MMLQAQKQAARFRWWRWLLIVPASLGALCVLTWMILSVWNRVAWALTRPESYSMVVRYMQSGDQEWTWQVVVHRQRVVKIIPLAGENMPQDEIDPADLTVDYLLWLTDQMCTRQWDECLYRLDPYFHYPEIYASSSRAIRILWFRPCATIEDCLIETALPLITQRPTAPWGV